MRPPLDDYMMALAGVAASRTTCVRKGVGCVLADAKGRVLAVAYNGVASGLPHCNEEEEGQLLSVGVLADRDDAKSRLLAFSSTAKLKGFTGRTIWFTELPHACSGHDLPPGQDSCEAVHAEQNAVVQCADPDAIATAYVTTAPCRACMKLLLNTGCRRIVYAHDHPGWEAVAEVWTGAGRLWERHGGERR